MLEVFDAVARNRSFTRASEELHLSQPAVSMQVKQMEESIGLPLFEQIGRKIYLTEAGREMHYYSAEIDRLLSDAASVIENLRGGRGGSLTISVASTATHFATRWLAEFAGLNEGVTYSLDVTNREGLLKHLEDNAVDLVIMGKPPEGYIAEAFMDNPLVIIAPVDHALCGKSVSLEQLQGESFVVREKGSGTRIAMERYFQQKGVEFNIIMEMTSNEAIKHAVQAGLGLGIVSIHTLELELQTQRIEILDVEAFPILRHWYFVYREEKRLSPVANNFRDYVLKASRSLTKLNEDY